MYVLRSARIRWSLRIHMDVIRNWFYLIIVVGYEFRIRIVSHFVDEMWLNNWSITHNFLDHLWSSEGLWFQLQNIFAVLVLWLVAIGSSSCVFVSGLANIILWFPKAIMLCFVGFCHLSKLVNPDTLIRHNLLQSTRPVAVHFIWHLSAKKSWDIKLTRNTVWWIPVHSCLVFPFPECFWWHRVCLQTETADFYLSSLFVLSNLIVLYNLFVENLFCLVDLARRADHPIVSIHSPIFCIACCENISNETVVTPQTLSDVIRLLMACCCLNVVATLWSPNLFYLRQL